MCEVFFNPLLETEVDMREFLKTAEKNQCAFRAKVSELANRLIELGQIKLDYSSEYTISVFSGPGQQVWMLMLNTAEAEFDDKDQLKAVKVEDSTISLNRRCYDCDMAFYLPPNGECVRIL